MAATQKPSFDSWLEKWLDSREKIRFTDFFGSTAVTMEWTTGDRTLSEHLVYLVTRESLSGLVAGKSVAAGPGTFLWVPAGVRHHLRVGGTRPFSVKFFRFGFSDPGKYLCPKWPPLLVPGAWHLLPIVDEVIRLHARKNEADKMELRCLVALLLIRARTAATGKKIKGASLGADSIDKLERLVEKNISGRLVPAELARHLGLTPDYFSRIFQKTMGRSPKRWLMEKRIQKANLLLSESPLKVSEVSELLGYDDVRLFTKQFKSVFRTTPGRIR